MLTGHLDIVCAADEDGRSYLRKQSFRAPIHLSKPHLDAGTLVVNVVNPTAGLLEGDRIDVRVAVERGASLTMTTPSASRAHQMGSGHAGVTQQFQVADGAWLENWPEIFIPQKGARYRQTIRILVEEGGGVLLFESVAPGRVASGELFEFAELIWETDVFAAQAHIARERYRLAPGTEAVRALRRSFPEAYYASCVVVAPGLTSAHPCWDTIHGLHREDAWIGCGPLEKSGAIVKIVAAGSIALRRTIAAVRAELYGAIGRTAPSLRRAG